MPWKNYDSGGKEKIWKSEDQSVFDESIVQKRDRKAKDKKIIRNIFWLLCTDSKNAFYSQKSEEINKKL